MSPNQLKKIKEALLEQKVHLLNKSRNANPFRESFDSKGDIMDQASTEGKLKLSLSLQNRDRRYLIKIEQALERIEKGIFGFCKDCEDKILFRRLQINPVTEFCVICQEEREADVPSHSPQLFL